MGEEIVGYILFLLLAFVIGLFIGTMVSNADISLSQEVGDDVCKQLTGNQSAVATMGGDLTFWKQQGKLICEIPSFDETQNIIIRKNNNE